MSEWRGLSQPNKVASTMPDLEVARSPEYPDGAPMPRFVVTGRDASNMPLGRPRQGAAPYQERLVEPTARG